jgi:hypothetical protein
MDTTNSESEKEAKGTDAGKSIESCRGSEEIQRDTREETADGKTFERNQKVRDPLIADLLRINERISRYGEILTDDVARELIGELIARRLDVYLMEVKKDQEKIRRQIESLKLLGIAYEGRPKDLQYDEGKEVKTMHIPAVIKGEKDK